MRLLHFHGSNSLKKAEIVRYLFRFVSIFSVLATQLFFVPQGSSAGTAGLGWSQEGKDVASFGSAPVR